MDYTVISFSTKMSIMTTSYIFGTVGAIHAYITRGLRSTFIEAHIPFTEPGSDAEFLGNFIVQSLIGILGYISYIPLEIFLSILEGTVTIKPKLIQNELILMIDQYKRKLISDVEVNYRMRNIVGQCLDADR